MGERQGPLETLVNPDPPFWSRLRLPHRLVDICDAALLGELVAETRPEMVQHLGGPAWQDGQFLWADRGCSTDYPGLVSCCWFGQKQLFPVQIFDAIWAAKGWGPEVVRLNPSVGTCLCSAAQRSP